MANETFNPNGYSSQQIADALAGVGDLQMNYEQLFEMVQYLATEEPKNKIKYRAAWVFSEVAAGASEEQTYTLSASIMSKTSGNPVAIVSPNLASTETFNPDLKYYAYIKGIANSSEATLVVGVYNGGSSAATPHDAAVVVL